MARIFPFFCEKKNCYEFIKSHIKDSKYSRLLTFFYVHSSLTHVCMFERRSMCVSGIGKVKNSIFRDVLILYVNFSAADATAL